MSDDPRPASGLLPADWLDTLEALKWPTVYAIGTCKRLLLTGDVPTDGHLEQIQSILERLGRALASTIADEAERDAFLAGITRPRTLQDLERR
jgi:hypothetical protein